MTTTRRRLRRILATLAVAAILPAAIGTAQAAAFDTTDHDLASTQYDGVATLAPDPPQLAPSSPYGEPDAMMSPDIIRVDLVTPKSCTYADKNYSDGSVVKMDGGVLRECKDGSWVPYKAPPKT
jgi:hypothetical protein